MGCCIKGCKAKGQSQHRFPNPRQDLDLFEYWLDVLRIEELYHLDPQYVYNTKRVCFAHFKNTYRNPYTHYLYRFAIPTIGVPAPLEGYPNFSDSDSD